MAGSRRDFQYYWRRSWYLPAKGAERKFHMFHDLGEGTPLGETDNPVGVTNARTFLLDSRHQLGERKLYVERIDGQFYGDNPFNAD